MAEATCEKCGEPAHLCPKCIQDWIENAKDKLREEFDNKLKSLRDEFELPSQEEVPF